MPWCYYGWRGHGFALKGLVLFPPLCYWSIRRIAWIRLNPYSLQTPEQLQDIHEIVLNYPTPYDLLKYARVLAFNGYEAEAKKQLWLLSTLWQVNVDYATLLDEAEPR